MAWALAGTADHHAISRDLGEELTFVALHAEDCAADIWVNDFFVGHTTDGISSEPIDRFLQPGSNSVRVQMRSLDAHPHERCVAEIGTWSLSAFPGLDEASNLYFDAMGSTEGVFRLSPDQPAPVWSRAERVTGRSATRGLRRYLRQVDRAQRRGDAEAMLDLWTPLAEPGARRATGAIDAAGVEVTPLGDSALWSLSGGGIADRVIVGRIEGQWRRMF